mmetsp:Transcript_43056/g.52918  ORF Transcript_43056/g.52918 Transcript_43056/m.52918 type:complete len:380 (+) Transcript_43056:40-1179(+)
MAGKMLVQLIIVCIWVINGDVLDILDVLWSNNGNNVSEWNIKGNGTLDVILSDNICPVSNDCIKINSISDVRIKTVSTLNYDGIKVEFHASTLNDINQCLGYYKMGNNEWILLWQGQGTFSHVRFAQRLDAADDNDAVISLRFRNTDNNIPCYIDDIIIYGEPININEPTLMPSINPTISDDDIGFPTEINTDGGVGIGTETGQINEGNNYNILIKSFGKYISIGFIAFIVILVGCVCCVCGAFTIVLYYYKRRKSSKNITIISDSNDNNNSNISSNDTMNSSNISNNDDANAYNENNDPTPVSNPEYGSVISNSSHNINIILPPIPPSVVPGITDGNIDPEFVRHNEGSIVDETLNGDTIRYSTKNRNGEKSVIHYPQ